MPYIITNTSKLIPSDEFSISVADRSFRFGDGIFDTVIVHNGRLFDLESHIERLQNGLKFFKINLDISSIKENAEKIIKKNKLKNGYIRIIISRGENAANSVGYFPNDSKPYYIIETIEKELPEFKAISLAVSTVRNFYKYPCKTNNSLHYVVALQEAKEKGFDNALLLDSEGNICETATGNIFWVKDNIIYTPSEKLPFVPGTISKKIIEYIKAPQQVRGDSSIKYRIEKGEFKLSHLKSADEVFMTNVGGIVTSINKVEGSRKKYSHTIVKQLNHLIKKQIKNS